MIRWLRIWYLRGLVVELELAIEAERQRHDYYPTIVRSWNFRIARLKQEIERIGGAKEKKAQPLLSGIKARRP